MIVLVRKFSPNKWRSSDPGATGQIAADAITADLRTSGNTLSFWLCNEPSSELLADVVLALAAGQERLDRMDLLWLSHDVVIAGGLPVANSEGHTPVVSLRNTHRDVTKLTYDGLGVLATLFADAFRRQQYLRFTQREVREVLVNAVRAGRLVLDHLNPSVRHAVEGALS